MSSPAPQTSSGAASGSNSGSATSAASGSASTNTGGSTTVLSIPQTAAAGGLTITQPPQTTVSFFKIAPSQEVTIAWNFTSLYSTPSHLTVSAICENGNTYPVGPTDGVLPGTATSVVWDPYSYNQANPNTPLAQATYTLSIWDDRGRNPSRAPGLFQPNDALTFALYKPQSYTPLASGWQCTGCSGSVSTYTSHPAFAGFIATLVVMILSGGALMRHLWR
ncbi:hypothetical protein PUNSTDRAFT_86698 [Punctularia strigosozonata HHB-11173 SS5]|uniref:uncharacterized protein n=1 Tax=Punctularia strigosozonata (strain HHB-11173) TaxID=741275 RepID=UPI00044180DD|nr:uncharacterized protein PUNSTDRAFT_86698 [Punctularia strigosozonata HHB-11173 SS5]EIN08698.1 hypothetical protein PUNSTDRAFT_86698 [Punctularia strigosozonata HHB-11173 SS5]